MNKFLLLVACAAMLSACGRNTPSLSSQTSGADIVHGMRSADTDLSRSVVALVMKDDQGEGLCTGSLLDDQTVLTAAHCVDHGSESLVVVFGANVKKASTLRRADAAIVHPAWRRSGEDGDLALVHFSGGLPEGYTPVTLAPKGTNLSAGTEEEMLGYGISNAGRQSGAGQLRQTSSTVLERVDRDQYMSDGRKSSVCFGDSGGPAFVQTGGRWAQWGVAHSVLNQACNEASVHTSVMPFLRWIQASQAKLAGSKN